MAICGEDGVHRRGRTWACRQTGRAFGDTGLRPAPGPGPCFLTDGADDRLLGEEDAPTLPLLLQAAQYLAETTNLWARECPRLIPVKVSAIVHWASIDLIRANDLVEKIVTWRDAAMHRYPVPDPAHPIGTHAELMLTGCPSSTRNTGGSGSEWHCRSVTSSRCAGS